ncbi:lysophospholipid acyltransferase family protein [uncultured Sphingomonas sp.]|uniref:lysophospholipid acyltransferase family protein n=1 Tax=uncultured Sphingomonas sp. TaxID=158754 RepID=UPI0030F5CA63
MRLNARGWARLVALGLALSVALLLHGAWRLFRRRSPWPRRFLGWVVRTVGTPLRHDAVLLANHVTWIDILALAGASGAAFVAKAELRDAPLVGWLCKLNNTLFVRRGERMGIDAQVAALRDQLAGPQPIAIFPEGTTGDGVTLGPFKAGLLAALAPPPPGVRVQPVRIDYGAATADVAWVGAEHGADHARRILNRRGTFVATLHFLEPFVPEGDRKAIAAKARAQIEAAA